MKNVLNLLLVLVLGLFVSFSFAKDNCKCGKAKNAAIVKALEEKNYDTWKEAISKNNPDSPLLGKVTKDNFDKFAEMHKLYKDKKTAEADVIRAELGLEKDKCICGCNCSEKCKCNGDCSKCENCSKKHKKGKCKDCDHK